ncbi:MAG TPA: hypothetical protein VGL61_09520 [Kofleriaceae bacterium]
MSKHYFSELAVPPAVLASLRRGMTKQAVAKLFDTSRESYHPVPGVREIAAGASFSGDLFEYTDAVLSPAIVKLIQAAWGPGASYAPRDERRVIWLDKAGLWRAQMTQLLGTVHIQFQNYIPFEKWLGDGDEVAALATSIVGKNVADLQREFGSFFRKEFDSTNAHQVYELELPATEWSPESYTSVDVIAKADGVVHDFAFDLWFNSEDTKKAVLRQLEKKWGTRTSTPAGWSFRSKAYGNVAVQDDEKIDGLNVISVKISSPEPLD